jgi:hypothetical protein
VDVLPGSQAVIVGFGLPRVLLGLEDCIPRCRDHRACCVPYRGQDSVVFTYCCKSRKVERIRSRRRKRLICNAADIVPYIAICPILNQQHGVSPTAPPEDLVSASSRSNNSVHIAGDLLLDRCQAMHNPSVLLFQRRTSPRF